MLSDYIWLFLTLLVILIMIFGNRKVRIISVFAMQFQVFKNARNNKMKGFFISISQKDYIKTVKALVRSFTEIHTRAFTFCTWLSCRVP